jgi:hypothetical protein
VSSEDGIGGGVAIAEYPEIDSIGASRSCAKAMRRSAKVTRRGKISDSQITFGHDEKTKPKLQQNQGRRKRRPEEHHNSKVPITK